MLSEYFIYIFMLYETAIIYAAARVSGKGRHFLLWLPVLSVGAIALTKPLADYFAGMSADPLSLPWLYSVLFAAQWNRHIAVSAAVCLALSVFAWALCTLRGRKAKLPVFRALTALSALFLIGTIGCAGARHFNFPYSILFDGGSASWVREENGVRYYRYGAYADISYLMEYRGAAARDVPVYSAPGPEAEIVGVIRAGQEFKLSDLKFSHAVVGQRGWRYAVITDKSGFLGLSGVRGCIRLGDAMKAFASGQRPWMYNCLARSMLLSEDLLAYDSGIYMTEDLSQAFVPLGVYLSAALCAGSVLLLAGYALMRRRG